MMHAMYIFMLYRISTCVNLFGIACLSFIFDAAVLVVALDVTIAQRLVARDGLMLPRV